MNIVNFRVRHTHDSRFKKHLCTYIQTYIHVYICINMCKFTVCDMANLKLKIEITLSVRRNCDDDAAGRRWRTGSHNKIPHSGALLMEQLLRVVLGE